MSTLRVPNYPPTTTTTTYSIFILTFTKFHSLLKVLTASEFRLSSALYFQEVNKTTMDEKRTHKRILEWKPIGRRIRGRPRKRWIEDIEDDIQIMGIRG
jgi:hypothetical protein